jgi:hypothetical protein
LQVRSRDRVWSRPAPKTATLRPFDSADLSQIHVALAAFIAELKQIGANDPDDMSPG